MHTQDNRTGTPQGGAGDTITIPISSRHGFATPAGVNGSETEQGFTTEDILWALGIWSAILFLSPVIIFYMLMVA